MYVLLLDAPKAFDKVAFNVLFNELYVIVLCVLRLQSYNTTCIQIKSDGVADCDTLSYNDICNLIDLVSLE